MTGSQRSQFERRTGLTGFDLGFLTRLPLFANMPPDKIRDLVSDAWIQGYPRNAVLFIHGEPATRFFVVLDGWIKLFRESAEGNESVIAIFTRGESFAEAAMFDQGVFPVSAMAVDDSRLLVVPADRFMRRLRDNSDYALNILGAMSRHLHRLVGQIEQLSAQSSTERLAGFLIRLCPDDAASAVIALPLDKALIAGRLGMQPETFSRSLKKLAQLGIESRRNEVLVPDVAALRAFSQGRDPGVQPMQRRGA